MMDYLAADYQYGSELCPHAKLLLIQNYDLFHIIMHGFIITSLVLYGKKKIAMIWGVPPPPPPPGYKNYDFLKYFFLSHGTCIKPDRQTDTVYLYLSLFDECKGGVHIERNFNMKF